MTGPLRWPRLVLCPGCLRLYKAEEIQYRTQDGEAVATPSRSRLPFRRRRVDHRKLRERVEAQEKGASPYCPDGDVLPPEMLRRRTFVLGLVGEKASSKSHYVTVLVQSLLEGALVRYGCTVSLRGESAVRFDNDYWYPLYHERVPLEATQVIVDPDDAGARRKPLLLELGLHTGETVNVLLYDASGEQMTSGTHLATYNKFLYASDALLIFVTPSVLVPKLRTGQENEQSLQRTTSIVSELRQLLGEARHGDPDADLKGLRVGVVLSKADQLVGLDLLDADMLKDVDYTETTLREVRDRVADDSVVVHHLMQSNGGTNLLLVLERGFPGASYHAVTATGTDADDTLHYPDVTPGRVLDPFIEVLAAAGVLREREGLE